MTADTTRGKATGLARRHGKVIKTINEAAVQGTDLSVAAIARLAGFSELKMIMDPRGVVASSQRFARRQ